MYLREHFLLVWGYKCSKLFIPPFFHLLQKKYVPQWHHILRWNSALRIRIFWSACKDGRAPFLLSVNTSWLFSVSLTDIFSFSEPQQRRFYPVTQCCKILLYAGMQDFCLHYLSAFQDTALLPSYVSTPEHLHAAQLCFIREGLNDTCGRKIGLYKGKWRVKYWRTALRLFTEVHKKWPEKQNWFHDTMSLLPHNFLVNIVSIHRWKLSQ